MRLGENALRLRVRALIYTIAQDVSMGRVGWDREVANRVLVDSRREPAYVPGLFGE